MHRTLIRLACGLALMWLAPSALTAQESVLTELYGSGVHQYFGGNYGRAYNDLTAAINGGTKDPRPYYFRALIQMRQGGSATADLKKAAELESADVNGVYPVGRSLERVQGASRLTLERYRAFARAEAHDRQLRRDAVRYEERRRAETPVLRDPRFKVVPKPPVALGGATTEDELFGEEDKKPAAKAAAPADEPFDDEPTEEMPAGDEKVDEEPAADEPPADEPTADMPEPPADEPAGDEPAPPEAEPEPEPADEMKTDEKADEGDPFADEKPAEKPE